MANGGKLGVSRSAADVNIANLIATAFNGFAVDDVFSYRKDSSQTRVDTYALYATDARRYSVSLHSDRLICDVSVTHAYINQGPRNAPNSHHVLQLGIQGFIRHYVDVV
eukprot:XP_001705213.1 Hypothetical protein GL50803_95430 [Giardia lamblia ATCC 50803]